MAKTYSRALPDLLDYAPALYPYSISGSVITVDEHSSYTVYNQYPGLGIHERTVITIKDHRSSPVLDQSPILRFQYQVLLPVPVEPE